jgi:hypothetical protein
MNERIRELLTEAGFCFWQDEEWGPGAGNIDWAPDYTKEFNLFVDMLLKDILHVCGDEILSQHYLEKDCCEDAVKLVKSRIQDRYGLK